METWGSTCKRPPVLSLLLSEMLVLSLSLLFLQSFSRLQVYDREIKERIERDGEIERRREREREIGR